ncbi:UDP-2,3-diacylglucosamine hydrolase [Escherichia coli]|nr:UDP-2,3-diacylglucosamine hydrolase [Escherichia coli]
MTLLPEEKVLELYGRRVLIMHGDTLCTDDAGYQAFRAKVTNPGCRRYSSLCHCLCANALPRNAREQQRSQQQ